MTNFKPCGRVGREHQALTLDVDGWTLGRIVVAAGDVAALLNGREVDLHFVQNNPGREAFIGFAGRAKPSRSGRAINFWMSGQLYTTPRAQIEAVATGRRRAARVSTPAPIIDADREQRNAIDHDLVRSFS